MYTYTSIQTYRERQR